MLDDIIKNQMFGKVKAYVTVIEFQKRGAPHSHTLICDELAAPDSDSDVPSSRKRDTTWENRIVYA